MVIGKKGTRVSDSRWDEFAPEIGSNQATPKHAVAKWLVQLSSKWRYLWLIKQDQQTVLCRITSTR